MSLDIWFNADISNRLVALAQSNSRAMNWARQFGANPRDVAIAQAAYQAALADVGVSFGLARAELVVILKEDLKLWTNREP